MLVMTGASVGFSVLMVRCLATHEIKVSVTVLYLVGAAFFFCFGFFFIAAGIWHMKPHFAVGGLAVLLPILALGLPLTQEVRWIGSRTTDLRIKIIDEETRNPIPNSFVRVFDHKDSPSATQGMTDSEGNVVLNHTFTAIGSDSLFKKTGSIYLWNESLEIESEGYESLNKPLENYSGPGWNLYALPIPALTIELRKK